MEVWCSIIFRLSSISKSIRFLERFLLEQFFLERFGLGRSDWWSGWGFNSSWGAWRESSGDGVIIKELQAGTANLETQGSTQGINRHHWDWFGRRARGSWGGTDRKRLPSGPHLTNQNLNHICCQIYLQIVFSPRPQTAWVQTDLIFHRAFLGWSWSIGLRLRIFWRGPDSTVTCWQIEGLAQCGVVDRLFLRVGLQIDRSQETIGLAQHRGELQVIHRRTAEFSQSLPIRRSHSLGVAIIGNITEYCRSLLDANLLSLIPVIFVVFNRDDKARLARQLIELFDCLRRSEPFDQNLSSCWSEGSAVVQELWLAHASRSATGVHRLC